MWSRNIANLLMSPLRPAEFVVALMVMSLIRLAVGVVPVTLMAIEFFGFNLWGLGFAFAAFFVVLDLLRLERRLVGFGSPSALRAGRGKSRLVANVHHSAARLHLLSCRSSARLAAAHLLGLPPTYVFEGLRGVLIYHVLRTDLMLPGLAIDSLLFTGAAFAFAWLLASARRAGTLLQTGE